ncbi:MAG: hypothetical protein ACJ73D_11185 [Pyrinomonadaceae bacterium]
MGFGRRVLGAVVVWVAMLGASAAYGQADCRGQKDYPPLAGHWKDDLNGQEIDIAPQGTLDLLPPADPRLGHNPGDTTTLVEVWATYSKEGKTCRDPDNDGKDVPFQIDFKAINGEHPFEIDGRIYWCDTETKDNKTYTTGVADGPIVLKESKDGMRLNGHFVGRNGREDISFTRLSKLPKYFAQVVVRTNSMTKIYDDTSTDSRVRYTPPAGTRLIIEDAQTDAAGNTTWYFVTNAEGSIGSTNSGWIQASKVICPAPRTIS